VAVAPEDIVIFVKPDAIDAIDLMGAPAGAPNRDMEDKNDVSCA